MSKETARDNSAPPEGLLSPPVAVPLQESFRTSTAPDLVRSAARTLMGYAVTVVVLVLLLTPPVVLLFAGVWSGVAYVAALRALYLHVQHYDLTGALPSLGILAEAVGVGVLSAGYFALLFSTMVLMAGLLGRSWWRTSLAPGLVLTVLSGLTFGVGAHLTAAGAAAELGSAPGMGAALTLYALFDAMVLAALLVDMRPPARRAHRRGWARSRAHADMPPAASTGILAAVRFGPITRGEPQVIGHVQNVDPSQAHAVEVASGEQPPTAAPPLALPIQEEPMTFPHGSADTASVA